MGRYHVTLRTRPIHLSGNFTVRYADGSSPTVTGSYHGKSYYGNNQQRLDDNAAELRRAFERLIVTDTAVLQSTRRAAELKNDRNVRPDPTRPVRRHESVTEGRSRHRNHGDREADGAGLIARVRAYRGSPP